MLKKGREALRLHPVAHIGSVTQCGARGGGDAFILAGRGVGGESSERMVAAHRNKEGYVSVSGGLLWAGVV